MLFLASSNFADVGLQRLAHLKKEENMDNLKKGFVYAKDETVNAFDWDEMVQKSETGKTGEVSRKKLKKPFIYAEEKPDKSELKKPFICATDNKICKEQETKLNDSGSRYLNQTEMTNPFMKSTISPVCFVSQEGKDNHLLLQTSMGVQPAEKIENQQYLITKKKKVDADTVANRIADTGILCSYENKLFYFSRVPPMCYQELKGAKIYHFIDKFINESEMWIERNRYDEVKKSLLYNHKIAVNQAPILPPNIWAFRNGLVDIRSGEMLPEPQKYFYTSALNCDYIPTAICPQFEKLLSVITNDDKILVENIWRIIGYLLSNDNNWKAFFVFQGPKDTGKSLLANIISKILGEDAVVSMRISEIGKKFTLSEMQDKKLAVCMDLTDELLDAIAVGAIKMITGNDLIRTEEKYKTGNTVRLRTRLLFGTNHPIRLKKPDSAFLEREVVIPFYYQIPLERQNKNLLYELKTEFSGIGIKAIGAYFRLVNDNYVICNVPLNISAQDCFDHEKIVKSFATERCDFSDPNAKISTQELFDEYINYANEYKLGFLEKDKFSEIFNRLNTTVVKKKIVVNKKSLQGYVGVKLKFQG